MRKTFILTFTLSTLSLLYSCGDSGTPAGTTILPEDTLTQTDTLRYPEEKHLRNVRQLTYGGNNAECYFSFDGKSATFQSDFADWGAKCDQIFTMPIEGDHHGKPQLVSTGRGRTTCSYFMPGDQQILYASTHPGGDDCPAEPDRSKLRKYVWSVFDTYDIFVTGLTGGEPSSQLTNSKGYDAEATVSPDGKTIVFTSTRSGDLELWTMNLDGSDPKQVTKELGYDGGAFFSPDSKKLVFRASRPKTEEEVKNYKDLLAQGLVEPSTLEIFTCNVDGSDLKQITSLGNANWAPFFHPSGQKIIFASNHKGENKRKFNLFMVNLDGTGLEQITYDGTFDAFAMFSPDGKHLMFSSNRFNKGGRDTNVFIAEWVE